MWQRGEAQLTLANALGLRALGERVQLERGEASERGHIAQEDEEVL